MDGGRDGAAFASKKSDLVSFLCVCLCLVPRIKKKKDRRIFRSFFFLSFFLPPCSLREKKKSKEQQNNRIDKPLGSVKEVSGRQGCLSVCVCLRWYTKMGESSKTWRMQ